MLRICLKFPLFAEQCHKRKGTDHEPSKTTDSRTNSGLRCYQPSLPSTTSSPTSSTSTRLLSVAHHGNIYLLLCMHAQDPVPFPRLTLLNPPWGNYPSPISVYVVSWSQPQGQHRTQFWPSSHSDHFRDRPGPNQ